MGTWNKPFCCVTFTTEETLSFLDVSHCHLPELVMRFMYVTLNDILNPVFSSWIIWDLLLISANFRFILGVFLCVICQQIAWMGGFCCVGVHKLWKPASHQAGVTAGGGVTKMPAPLSTICFSSHFVTCERGEAVQLLPALAHPRSSGSTAVRGKLVRCTGVHKLVWTPSCSKNLQWQGLQRALATR